jgi:CRISPR/Cas system endoribonuclease Cas6 (RAMP superfamily)
MEVINSSESRFLQEPHSITSQKRAFFTVMILLQALTEKFVRGHFTVSELVFEFPQIIYTNLYKIITVTLNYHEFHMRLILKMPMDAHKTENLCFDFLTEIPQG